MSEQAEFTIIALSIWLFWTMIYLLILLYSEAALRRRLFLLARRKAVREAKKQFERDYPTRENYPSRLSN